MIPLAAYLLLFLVVGIGFIFFHLVAGKLIRPNKPNLEKGTIYECGEPTIGSAWVQFDLRFYVVALLFVIFDVEVAFFFPWAEVFGKANAIATLDAPKDIEQWKAKHFVAHAEKVQDLAAPRHTSKSHLRDAQRYEAITGKYADGRPVLDEDGKPRKPLDDETLAAMRERQAKLREKQKAAGGKLTAEEAALMDFDGPLKKSEVNKDSRENNRDAASTLAWLALVEVLVFFGVLLVGFAYLWRRGDLEWVRSTAAERMEDRAPPPPVTPPPSAVRETVAS